MMSESFTTTPDSATMPSADHVVHVVYTECFPLTRTLTGLGAVPVAAQAGRTQVRDGNRLYSEGRFTEAHEKYLEALREDPESPLIRFNAGNALYQDQDLQRAVAADRHAIHARAALAEALLSMAADTQAREVAWEAWEMADELPEVEVVRPPRRPAAAAATRPPAHSPIRCTFLRRLIC